MVLLVLWEDESVTVKEIGRGLYLDSGTLTPMLKWMETARVLYRHRSPKDERSVIISLTDKGKEAKKGASSIPFQLFEQLEVEEEELIEFKASLLKTLERVHQKNQEM